MKIPPPPLSPRALQQFRTYGSIIRAIERGDRPNGKQRLACSIPADLDDRVRTLAALSGKPLSWFVERALEAYLRHHPVEERTVWEDPHA